MTTIQQVQQTIDTAIWISQYGADLERRIRQREAAQRVIRPVLAAAYWGTLVVAVGTVAGCLAVVVGS